MSGLKKFMGMMAGSGGRLAGYAYRRRITIDNTGNILPLSGTQIQLSLTSSNFTFSNAMANGEDVVFTQANGSSILPHWKQSYNSGAQTAVIFVAVSGVLAAQTGYIYVYYGKPGSVQSSSFLNTMVRFPTTEPNAEYVVRFNDGSGASAANIGTVGGVVSLNGGYTWNSTNIWGDTDPAITLNGTTGYVSKAGLLDSYPTEGHIFLNFNFVSFSGSPRIFSKMNRAANIGGDFGDFINLQVRSSDKKLAFSTYSGAIFNSVTIGNTVIQTGANYAISLVWNSVRLMLWLTKEGGETVLEFNLPMAATVNPGFPPNGSSFPFFIGANHATGTGAASAFANMKVNDFAFQSYQPYLKDIIALHNKTNRVFINEQTKWDVSRTPTLYGADPNCVIEPDLIYDNGQWVLYYILYGAAKSPTHELYRTTASAIDPNTTVTWSTPVKVLGGGGSGVSAGVSHCAIRKFGSTYYAYFRKVGDLFISVATSSDGITFNASTIALAVSGGGFGSLGYFNTDVIFDPSDNLYKMLVEASTVGNVYTVGLATCATPNGTFALSGSNPKSTMLYGNGTGNWGGPAMQFIGNVIHCWFHSKETFGGSVLPMDIYRSYSSDFNTWTKPYTKAVIIRERSFEYDQASDTSRPIEMGGSTYMVFGGYKNAIPFLSAATIAKYNGTLAQLVTDLSLSYGSEE